VNLPAGDTIDIDAGVEEAVVEVPYGSWMAIAAFNKNGESGFSNHLKYGGGTIQPSVGGQIHLRLIDPNESKYFEDFESYSVGDDPAGWIDTEALNSMTENDSLFKVFDVGGSKVFGTESALVNIHSHYTGMEFAAPFEFTGRMHRTGGGGGGVTFLSDYPNSDKYYRLRSETGGNFWLSPHPNGRPMGGDAWSNTPFIANQWYRFKINVTDTGDRIEIKAKVWKQSDTEPTAWQIDCYDDSVDRYDSGKIGVWTMYSGIRYFDDLEVK
jgi:hypothetical protein